MSTVALLMAGGRGGRMRASGVELSKPLVPVAGRPLIDWNLRALLRHGFDDVVVAAAASDDAVCEHVEQRLVPCARAAGARLRLQRESMPLGNIGAAGAFRDHADVLVVYSDNITAIDLGAVFERHRRRRATLTLAAHEQPFRIPYGRLQLDGDMVVSYSEKPQIPVLVASAVAVLAPAATALLPADRPTGLSDLTQAVLDRGLPVIAYRHSDPWVDVNDSGMLADAERLLSEHPRAFALP